MVGIRALGLLILILAGCTPTSALRTGRTATPLTLHNAEISTDTLWSNRVVIDGQVKVYKGSTLTIAPGTEITFLRRDADQDGLGDGTLIIEGSLQALGTAAQPIRFRSAATDPQPGDWLEIRVDFSKETHLRFCEIRDSAHGLHAHFTKALVEESHIHHNLDGCRLGQGNFIFRHNLIEENEGKGINFRNSTIEISANIIRRNYAGIFLFETDRNPTITGNNLYANTDNLRLGDFFHRDVEVGNNWWGSADPAAVKSSIYDARADATLGHVTVGIAPAWLNATGPTDALEFRSALKVTTGGFVDTPPLPIDDDLLLASWDGSVRRLDRVGQLRWQHSFKEVIDAPLLVGGDRIFGQNWGREVFALDAGDGRLLWSMTYPPSPSDDHRQGGLTLANGQLLVPAWNGTLYALDPQNGSVLWSFSGRAPLRSRPVIVEEEIILAGGDGTLSSLNKDGSLRWQYHSPGPLLTAPLLLKGKIITVDREGHLTCLNADGELLWRVALNETCYYAAPVASDDGIIVATAAGALWKIDPDNGATIWRKSGFGPIYATPLVSDRFLIIGDNFGTLWAIDTISANTLARHEVGGAIQGEPAPFADGIALGSRDQQLHYLLLEELATP